MPVPRRECDGDGNVLLSPPPARNAAIDPTVEYLDPGTPLLRIYHPSSYSPTGLAFRRFGPLARFDHQRAGPRGPRQDPTRGILYAAPSLLACIAEVFGDPAAITLPGWRLARLRPTDSLSMLDLRGTAATGVRTIPAIGSIGERRLTQAWARWWYTHRGLTDVCGLVYTSAHSGETSVALWERAASRLTIDRDWDLDDAAIRADVDIAAYELHLPIL